jgi:cold shock CspA family protein
MITDKYLGRIKWFRDLSRDADYGFITNSKLGEVFFHKRNISKTDTSHLELFTENQIVTFQIDESADNKKGPSAKNVTLLTSETDLIFLVEEILRTILISNYSSDFQKEILSKLSKIKNLSYTTENDPFMVISEKAILQLEEFLIQSKTPSIEIIKLLKTLVIDIFSANFNKFTDILQANLTDTEFFNLWAKDVISVYNIDYIARIILNIQPGNQNEICKKFTPKELNNLFHKILYDLDTKDDEISMSQIKSILNLSININFVNHDKIRSIILEKIPIYSKLELWLEGYHEILDFHSFKIFTITLSPDYQRLFVKKVAHYVHQNKVNLTFEELSSIIVVDYGMSKSEELYSLDYSTSIILHIMSELKKNSLIGDIASIKAQKSKIYEIVLNSLKDPKDVLEIKGYFDNCKGITYASLDDNQKPVLRHIEDRKPRFHTVCDGRKAVNNRGENVNDEVTGLCYWWCANQKCFDPCRKTHDSSDWKNYNLEDLLKIFKIDYQEKEVEIYLSLINKTNRFFKHLKCRSCASILHPTKQANYAFFGVNNFTCRSVSCPENGKEIYLTHCLNGRCEMEIDSRDSVKCKPDGHDQNTCGWYICNYCLSCCSTPILERRKYVTESINHRTYSCQIQGHKELNQICCNKCGSLLKHQSLNIAKYEEILSWLENNKNNQSLIRTYGQNNSGKKYFVLCRGNYNENEFKKILNYYYALGFNIPDLHENKSYQLISEPYKIPSSPRNIWKCTSCTNTLDFKDDREQEQVFLKFHFPKI